MPHWTIFGKLFHITDDYLTVLSDGTYGGFLLVFHKAAVAHDIGAHDGCQLAFATFLGHGITSLKTKTSREA